MSDAERVLKIEMAEKLLKEVEASYEMGHPERHILNSGRMAFFGFGPVGILQSRIQYRVWREKEGTIER